MMPDGVGAAIGQTPATGVQAGIDKSTLPPPPVLGVADGERSGGPGGISGAGVRGSSDKAMLPPPPTLATTEAERTGGVPGGIPAVPPMKPLQTNVGMTSPAVGETPAARQG